MKLSERPLFLEVKDNWTEVQCTACQRLIRDNPRALSSHGRAHVRRGEAVEYCNARGRWAYKLPPTPDEQVLIKRAQELKEIADAAYEPYHRALQQFRNRERLAQVGEMIGNRVELAAITAAIESYWRDLAEHTKVAQRMQRARDEALKAAGSSWSEWHQLWYE